MAHTQNDTVILAQYGDCRLVRYSTGESRIEHKPSNTCSRWLHHSESDTLTFYPHKMEDWALDDDMGTEAGDK